MNVDENVWGTEYVLYDNLNQRTGTTSLDDSDYTDYPPFTRNNLAALGSNPTGGNFDNDAIYIGYLNGSGFTGPWNPDADFNYSIAYTACKNPDIFINNTIGVGVAQQERTINYDYNYNIPNTWKAISFQRSDSSKITPIMFKNYQNYMEHRPTKTGDGNTLAGGNAYQPYYASMTAPNMYNYNKLWTPDGAMRDTAGWDTTAHRNDVNINGYMSYWRDFGIRSLIGVIKVVYFDGTYSSTTDIPQNVIQTPITLHDYEANPQIWRDQHPILAAYCELWFRKGADGTYDKTRPNDMCFVPDITNGLKLTEKWGIHAGEKYWQPIDTVYNNGNSFLPLFGPISIGGRTSSTISGTVQIGTQLSTDSVSMTAGLLVGYDGNNLHVGFNNQGTSNYIPMKTMWLELEGTDENLEKLRKAAAAYGLFFTDGDGGPTGDYPDLFAAGHDADRWTNENMCLGVVGTDGYTDGTYTRGTDNEQANNFLWKTASESTYDPSRPPPTPDNQYSDATVFNQIGDLATMFKRYVISASEVETLGKDLFKITDDLAVASPSYDDYATEVNSSFLVSNPLDCIISLRRFPMEIPKDGTYTNIKLGTHTITTCGYGMEKTAYTYLFEMSNPIYPNFGDSFLDYEPFTDYELYVPFCGTVKLNPRDIIGRKLSVQLVVDYTTGTATGFVMSDNLVIETVNGNIAIDIPVTGLNSATIASQLNNAIAQRETSYYSKMSQGFETAKSFLNPLKMGGAVGNLAKSMNAETSHQLADYNLQHQEASPHTIGAATPVGLWAIDLNCRLICYFPTGEVITSNGQTPKLNSKIYDFGATQGFATVETNTLGSYTGLVIASNPLTGGFTTQNGMALTDTEIQGIISDLAEGVIV